jgi:hypothetical protein
MLSSPKILSGLFDLYVVMVSGAFGYIIHLVTFERLFVFLVVGRDRRRLL